MKKNGKDKIYQIRFRDYKLSKKSRKAAERAIEVDAGNKKFR